MNSNEILLIYGTEYRELTKQLLKEAGLSEMITAKHPDKKKEEINIVIKPNLVAPVPASDGGTTHPEVTEGLICYLKEHGYHRISIMESSWVGDKTEESFEVCGYEELAQAYQVELLDMKKAASKEIDCAGLSLTVCQPPLEADYLINVPVLKGHCQTRITCALKNMKGLLPDSQKRAFHRMGLHEPIGHLSAGIKQDFILVDSICGDLSFEDGGNPVKQDRLIAACDPVLCDTFCCSLLEIEPEEVPYIGYAEKSGCGSSCLEAAQVKELNRPIHPVDLSSSGRAVKLAEAVEEVESCSACYGYLIPALAMLSEEGLLEKLPEKICIGQGYRKQTGILGVGNCTRRFKHHLPGCPPTEQEIYEFLKALI